MQPLILHAHATGPNPIKIAIACEFLSVPYTVKMWDFGEDAEKGVKGAAFLKINENGRVRESCLLPPFVCFLCTVLTISLPRPRCHRSGNCSITYCTAALEDPNTGVVSWESGAIMNYIRRNYDKQNKLGPRGSTEQHIVDFEKWEYFLLTTLGPMTGQTNWVSTKLKLLHHAISKTDNLVLLFYASCLTTDSSDITTPPKTKMP